MLFIPSLLGKSKYLSQSLMRISIVPYAYIRYGDSLSSGWRNIMDVVMRLHKLGLLPAAVAALEGEDPQEAAARLPRLTAPRNMASTPSFISRAFSRYTV